MTTIRPAQPADTPHIHRLIHGLAEYERMLHHFSATETDLHHALFSPHPSAHALLAEHNGTPIGMALFYYTFNTFKARHGIFLEDLFVEPDHRGHGIGLALMRALAQRAATEGCTRIEWRVLNWNQPSIDFYERIGAEQITDWQTRQLGGEALLALAEGHAHG
jgi:GNAT superfamily N-acetyltransferase